MTAKDITLDLIIRYGFQILGALIILIVGVLLARWIGNLTNRGLEARVKEPPMRLLIQGVGTRFDKHFDRAWRADESRATHLVLIGQALDAVLIEAQLRAALSV